MYHKILVPVDLSDNEQAHHIIDIAEDMASKENAELHIITVVPTFSMAIVGSHFPKDYEQSTLEEVKGILKASLDKRNEKGVAIKGHVVHGTIYDEIMKAADKLGCDLIVMASHRPELKDYLLGPNAARVVRHANQSVFVVRS